MENTNKGIVLPLDAEWSDIGSWKSVWENSNKDSDGNVLNGNVVSKNSENCYMHSENQLLVGLGVKDLIIIGTDDATLVADKNQSENIKGIVSEMQLKNFKEASSHKEFIDLGVFTCQLLKRIDFR